jgi:hypothetical protein
MLALSRVDLVWQAAMWGGRAQMSVGTVRSGIAPGVTESEVLGKRLQRSVNPGVVVCGSAAEAGGASGACRPRDSLQVKTTTPKKYVVRPSAVGCSSRRRQHAPGHPPWNAAARRSSPLGAAMRYPQVAAWRACRVAWLTHRRPDATRTHRLPTGRGGTEDQRQRAGYHAGGLDAPASAPRAACAHCARHPETQTQVAHLARAAPSRCCLSGPEGVPSGHGPLQGQIPGADGGAARGRGALLGGCRRGPAFQRAFGCEAVGLRAHKALAAGE